MIGNIISIKTLKVLSLYGNPVSLLKNYFNVFINEFKFLKYFDSEKIDWEGIQKQKEL
jgi:hypothetical protein